MDSARGKIMREIKTDNDIVVIPKYDTLQELFNDPRVKPFFITDDKLAPKSKSADKNA